MTGTHLADSVKAFGSIDADATTDPNAVKANRRTGPMSPPMPAQSPSAAPKKPLDLHSLFGAKPVNGNAPPPVHDRRQSIGQGSNGMPYPMPGMNAHLRPPAPNGMPNQPRSPVLGNQMPQIQQGFRPPMTNGQQVRPMPQGMMGQPRPNMMMGPSAYGMHPSAGPYQMMGYPANYYDGYNVYQPQQFAVPQWAPQQHPQNQQYNMSMSPRPPPPQMGSQASPQPPSTGLPGSGGGSPIPTPPSRPASLMGHQPTPSSISVPSIPSTPSRPAMQPAPSFTPQATGPFSMSGGAASFTPRAKSTIKISRPDGTEVDLKKEAAAVKPPSVPSSGVATPEPSAAPAKPAFSLPVVVKIQSEEQKREEAERAAQAERIKKEEELEEKERRERKARQAKEEEDRKAKEEERKAKDEESRLQQEQERKAKEEADRESEKVKAEDERKADQDRQASEIAAEDKRKMEDAFAAEQVAAKKLNEEREAIAKGADNSAVEEAISSANEAREKADEQRRALLTPAPSTPASPLASPALVAAGLPPKPISAPGVSRRPIPAALDVNPSSPAPSEPAPSAATAAMSNARPIEDLSAISYPGSVQTPRPELNADAKPGKFRYDRDFLMQFMSVCRDKPEGLPNLEDIGLEADSSSGFGTTRGQRGSRNSMGPPGRGPPTGLGIGNLSRPGFSGQSMGNFSTGSFGGGSLRGTTSEDRYNRSLAQGRVGSMTRTPSSGGPGGLPPMSGLPAIGGSSSRGGVNRSQRGAKRLPQDNRSGQPDPSVKALEITQNAWVKSRNAAEEGSPAYIEGKVKSLLNKLTAERFDSISSQILDWANKSVNETDGMTLKLVIKQIFEKATDEAHWSAMYARLCRVLLLQLDPAISEVIDDKPVAGGLLFRKYLVGRCQVDFEAGWKAREDAATAAAAKSEEDKEKLAAQQDKEEGAEAVMMSDEYYAAQKAKRRGLGLVQLIGELYKLDMLGRNVIKTCFVKLLGNIENPDEEDVESTCKLLTTVGAQYETASPENTAAVFERLQHIADEDKVSSRIKFLIMGIMDQRKAGWKSRNQQAGVMTIAEIHQQAAREQAEKTAAVNASRDSISRGGSRAGHTRGRDGPGPGEWQAVGANAGPRPLQRPTDFSNIGRNLSSAGIPSAPTFGVPSSVFAKRKPGPGGATPPLSRQASVANISANPFSALGDEAGEAAPGERRESQDESGPQRKRLNLAPRTKPLPGQDDEEDVEAEHEAEEVATPAEATIMGESAAKSKIDSDMKELWGEKDVGGSRNPEDIVEYFRALPEERHLLLSTRLVNDVFRISKYKEAEVVGKGWSKALEQGVVTQENLKKTLATRITSLDDDSIDFPQAYKAVALLMRSLSLSDEEIEVLANTIEVDGTPRITPKMKLDRALTAVDEEAAKE
ncbi:hypothetical protein BCR39DRAFT_521719 [Naematelia encephala]|uniref:MIF4G domain-containing protein n=1 Tax=Naematelia encephala TaxID=71784 RepID=A0A1Y2BDC5_9TREE|nr:hypothetical protein BCR39DRAFT_521719 [Naematelia encephala]